MEEQLSIFGDCKKKATKAVVNVSSVPQRSPFRFPGGKTWLIPIVRKWLNQPTYPKKLVEPFTGGGIVSLTAAFENLVKEVRMIELDDEIAAVWDVIINGDYNWLAKQILSFDLTPENAKAVIQKENKTTKDKAFSTILKNRISHGGIITKGSGLLKNGEKGKGIKSRWYPKTLHDRITAIEHVRSKMEFIKGDAFAELEKIKNEKKTFSFIDPPYTVAGKRLYTHFKIDHEALFALTAQIKGKFMLTYDDSEEIIKLASKYDLNFRKIPMKTTHHVQKNEIIICDNFNWWD